VPVVKKTLAIHPEVDQLIRKVWAMLIEKGYNVSYSTALHFTLLAGICSMLKEEGLSEEEALKFVGDFMTGEKIEKLDMEDAAIKLTESLIHLILKRTVKWV
jgi:hypothetical protein